MKHWVYREYDDAAAERLHKEAGIPRLVAMLLAQRGITDPEEAAHFLQPKLDHLLDPYRMTGMRQAVERLCRAIERKERILIYGDYDVDGTIAVVVLRTAIELAGGQADFHVPHRVAEGYGMREEIIERAAREQVRLLISVDNGIRERAVIQRANDLGIECIVTDHHLPESELPPALAVLNPNQPGCPYPNKNLCGAGVAFKIVQALLGGLGWDPARLNRVLESFLKVVAIATVADMMPLTGENRVITRIGIEGLRRPRHPGLKALLDVAGLTSGKALSAEDLAFRLAPRLNAAGRMDSARAVIELLSKTTPERNLEVAETLDRFNRDRQNTESAIVKQILERFAEIPPATEMPVIVVEGEGWHPGVIGIVASRLVERYHRPTVVLSCDAKTGLATGSGRSIPAFHLLEGLESMREIFVHFGGHRQAAGCTLPLDKIAELRERLTAYAGGMLRPDDFIPSLQLDAEIPFRLIGDSLMQELTALAPYGLGNPAPLFSTASVRLASSPRVIKEKHLKLRIEHEKKYMTAMGWRMAERAGGLGVGSMVDTAFSIEPDDYRGGWQLILRDFRPSRSAAAVG